MTPAFRARLLGGLFADSPWLDQVRRAVASAALSERFRAGPAPFSEPDLRRLGLGFSLQRNEAFQVARQLADSQKLIEQLEQYEPENWRRATLDHAAMLTVMEDGIPLVWVPPAEVIRVLCAESAPARRRTVLVGHVDQILEHGQHVLASIRRQDLAYPREYLRECLDLLGDGRPAAAQALATSVWDTTIRALVRADPSLQNKYGEFEYRTAKEKMPPASMAATISKFRAYCLHTCLHAAWANYFGPPVPREYNRHATAHAVGPTQYTMANALVAFMNALGFARELEETQRPISPAD
ncbi:hypothetical protein [Streptomyces yatensis]|nr:hypothetical protein [Streptomyces yatensis]